MEERLPSTGKNQLPTPLEQGLHSAQGPAVCSGSSTEIDYSSVGSDTLLVGTDVPRKYRFLVHHPRKTGKISIKQDRCTKFRLNFGTSVLIIMLALLLRAAVCSDKEYFCRTDLCNHIYKRTISLEFDRFLHTWSRSFHLHNRCRSCTCTGLIKLD